MKTFVVIIDQQLEDCVMRSGVRSPAGFSTVVLLPVSAELCCRVNNINNMLIINKCSRTQSPYNLLKSITQQNICFLFLFTRSERDFIDLLIYLLTFFLVLFYPKWSFYKTWFISASLVLHKVNQRAIRGASQEGCCCCCVVVVVWRVWTCTTTLLGFWSFSPGVAVEF